MIGLTQYRKLVSADDYGELARAVGLAAHGIGIGSFAYLRRIFERLINLARDQAAVASDWDEAAFQRSRMEEKIELLKAHLPSFLVEQRKLYSILSIGIHSLTEKQCIEAFPVLRLGIELILDEKVAAVRKKEKLEAAAKDISRLQQLHSK
jgi:hypothetical protein